MSTTEEVPVARVGGRLQWGNIGTIAKRIGLLVAALTAAASAVNTLQVNRAKAKADIAEQQVREAQARAAQAKDSAEAGFQKVRPYVTDLEHRLAANEAETRELRQQVAKLRGVNPRRVVRPLPVRPAPLPKDLNAAEKQVQQQVYRGTPKVGPMPAKVDAGAGTDK